MKKLPNGISNYRELIEGGYYYVDKTMYIEKLENLTDKRIVFLRPRKFGKTLFTSTLQYYYDINEKDKFEELYKETYIGKNPTCLKNSYHILRFNFSGVDTATEGSTIEGFKDSVQTSIKSFVAKYKLDFIVNPEQTAEGMLNSLIEAFAIQKATEKIYVIIDEYDHFANELLGFQTDLFKRLVTQNGKVRKWYEILKKGTESVVDRIFITGVTPITLDSMTSGFNISSDLTKDGIFNEMLGFTKEELKEMMENQEITEEEQKEIFPIMKENYDGYKFSIDSETKMYNSNMCLYFLNQYLKFRQIPRNLVDTNIASDYSKLGNMLKLCQGEGRKQILEDTLSDKGIMTEIIEKFNPEIGFEEREFVSMLFYLGYLTIDREEFGKAILKIPNQIMREIYASYFLKIISDETNLKISENEYNEMIRETATTGKINKIVETMRRYLNNLSNRDYINFDEKYVKLIFYCIAMNLTPYSVRTEQENNRTYQDIILVPRDTTKGYQAVLIEFKYLKKEEASKLEEKQKEAREQIMKYSELEQIKNIPNLHKYTIIAVNDEVYVEKI